MQLSVLITYRHLEKSEALERFVRLKAARLLRFGAAVKRCEVVIEAPHLHHHQGNIFHVRVRVLLPGGEIVAARDPGQHHAHEDVRVAVRDAFRAARRALMEHVRSRRGEVKTPARLAYGRVAHVEPGDGAGSRFGFLATRDGREVYFHENSVPEGFDRLEAGTRVRFAEEAGEAGPQASTVWVQRTPGKGDRS